MRTHFRTVDLQKDEWVFAFAMELLRVRPRLHYAEAETRARLEWPSRGRLEPRIAARRWLGEQSLGNGGH